MVLGGRSDDDEGPPGALSSTIDIGAAGGLETSRLGATNGASGGCMARVLTLPAIFERERRCR